MAAQPSFTLAIRNQIVTYLQNEQNQAGTNPTGRLQSVKSVGTGWVDSIALWPYIGVIPLRETVDWVAVGQKDITIIWSINTVVRSALSTADAYNQLVTLMADGEGNGVNEVLDDFSHFTMDNLVYMSKRTQTDYFDDLVKDKSAGLGQYAAYSITQFTTKSRLNVR